MSEKVIEIPPVDFENLYKNYNIQTQVGKKALEEVLRFVSVMDRKNRDYGNGNIGAFGELGVLVRCWDKISRLRNLIWNNKSPNNEAIEDTWQDLSIYALIAYMLRKGKWVND